MRHNKAINHLGRKSGHRKALLANMATSLIQHKRIVTTVAKAKALQVYVEPLITKSKDDSTNSRRVVFSYLKNKEAVTELSVRSLLRSLIVQADTHVSLRLVSVMVTVLTWLSSSSLISTRLLSLRLLLRLPRRQHAAARRRLPRLLLQQRHQQLSNQTITAVIQTAHNKTGCLFRCPVFVCHAMSDCRFLVVGEELSG